MHGLSDAIATFGALVWLLGIPAALFMAAALPFLAFSAVRNLRRARVALERIADALESPARAGSGSTLKL